MGMFPLPADGGVAPSSTTSAFEPTLYPAALYFPKGCGGTLTNDVLNSILSELAQVIDAGQITYDPSKTDNLKRALAGMTELAFSQFYVSATPPTAASVPTSGKAGPIRAGAHWYDTALNKLMIYQRNGAGVESWVPLGGGGVEFVSGPTPPATPVLGMFWWDTLNEILFFRASDGTTDVWLDISGGGGGGGSSGGGFSSGPNPPASPQPGALWFDDVNEILFAWVVSGTGSAWVDISTVAGAGSDEISDYLHSEIWFLGGR